MTGQFDRETRRVDREFLDAENGSKDLFVGGCHI